jgi:hypothetical protein
MGICNLAESIRASGFDITDTTSASPLYNDNQSCVRWSHNMTTQQIRHMEMRENVVREWVQDSYLQILHVPDRTNPADIFTKEMQDGAHFWCLRDSFMCTLADFFQQSLLDVHLSCQQAEPHLRQVLPYAASLCAFTSKGTFLSALCSSLLSWTLAAISHLSSAGCHIIRSLHPVVPSVLI